MVKIGEILQAWMSDYGLSQAEAAHLLGVRTSVLKNWLGGRNAPGKMRVENLLSHSGAEKDPRLRDFQERLRGAQVSRPELISPTLYPFTGPGPWNEPPVATTLAELWKFIQGVDLSMGYPITIGALARAAESVRHATPETFSSSEGTEHIPYILEAPTRWSAFVCDKQDDDTVRLRQILYLCRRSIGLALSELSNDEQRLLISDFVHGPEPQKAGV